LKKDGVTTHFAAGDSNCAIWAWSWANMAVWFKISSELVFLIWIHKFIQETTDIVQKSKAVQTTNNQCGVIIIDNLYMWASKSWKKNHIVVNIVQGVE